MPHIILLGPASVLVKCQILLVKLCYSQLGLASLLGFLKSSGWPPPFVFFQIHSHTIQAELKLCVAKDHCEFLIFLPLPP